MGDVPAGLSSCRPVLLRSVERARSSPAAWLFALVWLLSAATLVQKGHGTYAAVAAALLLYTLLLTLASVWLAPALPAVQRAEGRERSRFWAQAGVLLLFVGLTAYDGLLFHQLLPADAPPIPLWTQSITALRGQGPFGIWVANPLAYMILPGACLLLLGARPRELGLGPGRRIWAIVLAWTAVHLVHTGLQIALGGLTPGGWLFRVASHTFQNGLFEEFLFRGALQTRLSALLGGDWGLVLSSLLFGLWHLGANTAGLDHDWLAGLAFSLLFQAVSGLGFGVAFRRTGNLAAPSIIHVVGNAAG